jgi:hypothetical protein
MEPRVSLIFKGMWFLETSNTKQSKRGFGLFFCGDGSLKHSMSLRYSPPA